MHTPASKDYAQPGVSYLDILRKAEKEGLAAIAFTDHNTVQGYAAMRQEIADLERWELAGRIGPDEKARLEEYRRLLTEVIVFPGFELTATFGFHILAMFDPATPLRTIELTLLRLNVPGNLLTAGETEVGSTTDVISAYRDHGRGRGPGDRAPRQLYRMAWPCLAWALAGRPASPTPRT